MKTKIFSAMFIMAIHIMLIEQTQAQSSSDNNNPLNGKFLGYNGAQNLDFRTNNISRMRLMQTGGNTVDGYNYNHDGFLFLSMDPTQIDFKPFSLLHLNGTDNNNFGPQPFGYRDWMAPGLTFTHNRDLMYVGPRKNGGVDISDAVIAWADNPTGPDLGPDVLRFLFLGSGQGSTSISSNPFDASDYDGVEIARMTGDGTMGIGTRWTNTIRPKRTLDIVRRNNKLPQLRLTYQEVQSQFGGIYSELQTSEDGNLHIAAFNNQENRTVAVGFLDGELDDPFFATTKLDVGGRVRVRDLPDNNPQALIIGYTMADINDADEDQYPGRLDFPTVLEQDSCIVLSSTGNWVNLCDLSNDCRWQDVLSETVVDQIDMVTGLISEEEDDCDRGKVGIGVDRILAKLDVLNFESRDSTNIGIRGHSLTNSLSGAFQQEHIGVYGIAEAEEGLATAITNIGVRAEGRHGRYAVGTFSTAISDLSTASSEGVSGITGTNVGVVGISSGDASSTNIGIYGEILPGPAATVGNPGYFVGGSVAFSDPPIIFSDASLKQNVEEIDGAMSTILQLNPLSYSLQSPDVRPIRFSEGLNYGFIAQEVQEVLPDLVESTVIPPLTDSTGFVENTSYEVLGIKYNDLIPIIVAALKEQAQLTDELPAIIAEQEEEISALKDLVAAQSAQLSAMQDALAQAVATFDTAKRDMENCCGGKAPATAPDGAQGKVILEQNYPNPFTSETRIDFYLPYDARIVLEVSDAQGRKLHTLIEGQFSEGNHSTTWDAGRYAPGIYYCSLFADGELITKKMIKM